jgi:hypothetical protein
VERTVSFQDRLEDARRITKRYYVDEGALCTIRGLTWNATKKLWLPPYQVKAENIPCSIHSLATLRDPDIADYIRTINISQMLYRRITLPYGLVQIVADDQIIKEPVTGVSDRYVVVEAVAPDETSSISLILHCRKVQ